jgi:hypothetical protein
MGAGFINVMFTEKRYICLMDDIKELKVTFWGHIRMIGFTLLLFAFFVFVITYSYKPDRPGLLFIMAMPFVFLILPVFYLHYQYSKCSDEISYKLNKNISIIQTTSSGEKIYKVDEFEQFKLIATKSKLAGIISKMPFNDYHYVKLQFKSGEELTFTCLYSSDIYTLLKSYFPGIPFTAQGVFYPNIDGFE